MRNAFITILVGTILLVSGCTEQEGVEVTLKQVIPITPTTSIEITKNLDFNEIDEDKPQNYIIEKSKFRIPVEIKNNNKVDYDDVYIRINKTSDIITKLLLYSYSGEPFKMSQEEYFKFNNKLIAKQTNELTLVGEVRNLPSDLTQGTIKFSLGLYQLNQGKLIPIANSLHEYELKICKTTDC
ncbi:MAG: hypothetical protein KAI72_02180 [Candidatus Pacebacteria bacterium]|nr:hypothetical protein [Candidatus Paceibacterota bacterium]